MDPRLLIERLYNCATGCRRNESDDDFLARATHLRLQNKGISSLGAGNVFDACVSLKVCTHLRPSTSQPLQHKLCKTSLKKGFYCGDVKVVGKRMSRV